MPVLSSINWKSYLFIAYYACNHCTSISETLTLLNHLQQRDFKELWKSLKVRILDATEDFKIKHNTSTDHSSRILAIQKTPEKKLQTCIHINFCIYPQLLHHYLDLGPFVLWKWNIGLDFACIKNSHIIVDNLSVN